MRRDDVAQDLVLPPEMVNPQVENVIEHRMAGEIVDRGCATQPWPSRPRVRLVEYENERSV